MTVLGIFVLPNTVDTKKELPLEEKECVEAKQLSQMFGKTSPNPPKHTQVKWKALLKRNGEKIASNTT